jgi:hypothetical protein
MADFERTASLSIVIPDRELRDARDELETALADIPVGVSGSAASGGAASAGAGGAREQRRRRREFRWARQRTDDVERQVELLENIESELVEGGFGGGPGGMIGDIIGLGGDAAGVAAEGAGVAADIATTAAGTAIGEAAGGIIANQLSGSAVGIDDDDLPLPVADPSPLTVEDLEAIAVEDTQPLAVSTPNSIPVDAPDAIPVERPEWQLRVAKPPWVPIGVVPPPSSGGGGGQGGPQAPVGVQVGERFREGLRGVPVVGDPLANFSRNVGQSARDLAPFTSSTSTSSPGQTAGAPQSVSAATGDVNITVDTNVRSAVQDAIQGLRREQQRQREALRRDLQRQISDLESQINTGFGGSSPVRGGGSGPR